jgi:predicted SprT family Zn-dependent metalloprotease
MSNKPAMKNATSKVSVKSGSFVTQEALDQQLAEILQSEQLEPASYLTSTNDDPNPDLHLLFQQYNQLYFYRKLDHIEVRWSKRMTRCAGMCYYFPGGYCSVRLSEPLLKFRPRLDFVNTLLHELIHAYLFVTNNNTDRDGHGETFLDMARSINNASGSKITVYHSFRDEVRHYQTHVWQCDGPCKDRPPFFGRVSRSMNRPPQAADRWFPEHQVTCGGTFTKISSPPEKPKTKKLKDDNQSKNKSNAVKKKKETKAEEVTKTAIEAGEDKNPQESQPNLDGFVKRSPGTGSTLGAGTKIPFADETKQKTKRTVIEISSDDEPTVKEVDNCCSSIVVIKNSGDGPIANSTVVIEDSDSDSEPVQCPVCMLSFELSKINSHLDGCIGQLC